MCKIVITDEEGLYKTCFVSGTETPKSIMKYCKINLETKILYVNGKALTSENFEKPFPEEGTVYLAIQSKTTMRMPAAY